MRGDYILLFLHLLPSSLCAFRTPISRLRAFLRLAMMQKKLFDFYTVISNSPLLKRVSLLEFVFAFYWNRYVFRNFYEDWALLRQEQFVQLCGALLGLSVIDCNLVLEHDHLQVSDQVFSKVVCLSWTGANA